MHGGANNGTVSAFSVGSDGTLTSIGASPYADNQTAPCWVAISHDGSTLFAVNTGSQSVSSYTIGAAGGLGLIGTTALSSSGLRAFDAQLDPTDSYLYVVDGGTATISVLANHGGNLTELGGSPVAIPGGGSPFGIVVD